MGTVTALEGTFRLRHGATSVRLPCDVSAIGMETSLFNVLGVGKVSVQRTLNPSSAPAGYGAIKWSITFIEFSAITMSVFKIDVTTAESLYFQRAKITHSNVAHTHVVVGDTVRMSGMSVPGFNRYWTIVSVLSSTTFTINLLQDNRISIGWGIYQHSNYATDGTSVFGSVVKEPTLSLDAQQLYTTGALVSTTSITHEGSNTCCVSGSFKLAHSDILYELPGKVFALKGSPVVQTSVDLTTSDLLFRGASIKISNVIYTILENGAFSNATITLDRNFESTDSPLGGTIAFHREYTPMLPSDASAIEVDTALSDLNKFSGAGVSVIRGQSNKNSGYSWTVTFLQSSTEGDLPLIKTATMTGQAKTNSLSGAGVQLEVTEIIPGALPSVQSITTSASSFLEGTFLLEFRGSTSAAISHDASAAAMKIMLEALPTIGRVSVTRSSATSMNGFTWQVTFLSNAGTSQLLLIGHVDTTLKGTTTNDATITVAHVRSSTTVPIGGTFSLSFRGKKTTEIPYNAPASVVQTALEALPTIGVANFDGQPDVAVSRLESLTNIGTYKWTVTFLKPKRNSREAYYNLPMLIMDTASLTGTLCTTTYSMSVGCIQLTRVQESAPGSYISGAFDLGFAGKSTSFLQHNASAKDFRSAILLLNANKFHHITVVRYDINNTALNSKFQKRARDASGSFPGKGNDDGHRYQSGYRWCVEFVNVTGDIDTLSINGSRLEGAGVSVASEEQNAGYERLGGSYLLQFRGARTARIPHDASALEVTLALQKLSTIGSVFVSRSLFRHPGIASGHGFDWNVTFTSLSTPSNIGPLPLLATDTLLVTGTGIHSAVTRLTSGCCQFSLSSNGFDFTPVSLPFRFDAVGYVTSLSPTAGPASGGTIITVRGVGFWSGKVSCIFGEIPQHIEVTAARVSDTEIKCVAPAQMRGPLIAALQSGETLNDVYQGNANTRGSVRVRVNLGGSLLTNSTTESRSYFTYNTRSSVIALVPKTGPPNGGTRIRIHGHNFPKQGYARRGVLCKFGDALTLVVGTFLSTSEVECVSPSIKSQSSTQPAKILMKAFVTVEISFNGGSDFTSSGIQFWYRPISTVTNVVPSRGPVRGGTKVLVSGMNFERSPSLACKFGNSIEDESDSSSQATGALLTGPSVVPATWISSRKVSCIAPPLEPKSEIQLLTLRGHEIARPVQIISTVSSGVGVAINAGSFRLTFGDYDLDTATTLDGEMTSTLNHDTSAAALKTALELLDSVVAVDVSRTGPSSLGEYSWAVTFKVSAFAVPLFVADQVSLNGNALVTVQESVAGSNYGVALHEERVSLIGVAPQSTIQTVTLSANNLAFAQQEISITTALTNVATSGGLTLRFVGETTESSTLAFDASEEQMQLAVEETLASSSFANSIAATVRVTRSHSLTKRGFVWTVTYVGIPYTPQFATFGGIEIATSTIAPTAASVSAFTTPTVPLGGFYTLTTFNGVISPQLSFDATASTVENALNMMFDASFDSSLVSVKDSGPFEGQEKVEYSVIFHDSLGHVPLLSVNDVGLTGTGMSTNVQSTQLGTVLPLSGFTLQVSTFGSTAELPHSASAKQVEHAIETIGAASNLDVQVTREKSLPATTSWVITFPESYNTVGLYTTVNLVQRSTADGRDDTFTVAAVIEQQGTYEVLSGNFRLGFGPVAESANPSVTPNDIKNNLGETIEGKIQTLTSLTLTWDSSALQVQTALHTLPNVRHVEVSRSSPGVQIGDNIKYVGHVWAITFISYGTHRHYGSVPLLSASYEDASSPLTGNDLLLDIEVLQEGNGPFVPVEITNNGQQFSNSYVEFEYHPSIILGVVHPVSGPAIGGTKVVIELAEHSFGHSTGFYFDPEDADPLEFNGRRIDGLTCQFNTSIVPATVISTTSISCITPPHVSGNTTLKVSLNGEEFSESFVVFRFDIASRNLVVEPLTGPIIGGTVVLIRGLHFEGTWNMDVVKCSFGGEIVSAFQSTQHAIKCRTPPVIAPRVVSVEVSTNAGIDFTDQRAQFSYEEIRHVSSLHPRVGPSTGLTLVTVHGGPFPNYTDTLRCRFGNQIVPAFFISHDALQCVSPHLRPVREVQKIVFGPSSATASLPTGSQFSIQLGKKCKAIAYVDEARQNSLCEDQTTRLLNWDASAADMKFALEDLPSIGKVRVTRVPIATGTQEIHWRVTFMSDLQLGNIDQMVIVNEVGLPILYSVQVATLLEGSNEAVGRVAVEVSSNGLDFTNDGVVFEYQKIIKVTRIYPTHGPLYGRTEVYVYGENFRNTSGLYCHFGRDNRGASVPATAFINSSCIKCVSPPVLYVRSVRLEVSNNGADSVQHNQSFMGRWFTFDRQVFISNIYPKSAPTTGNSSIRVVGDHFLPTDEMKCKFGSKIVQGVWLNGHEVVCRTPTHISGSYNLEITVNDQDYTTQELPFLFYSPIYMTSIHPVSGPAWAAGTALHVYGGGFINTSTLSCRLADTTVPADYVSDTEIICYTPPCLNSYTGGKCHMSFQPLNAHEQRIRIPSTGSVRLFPTAHYFPLFYSKLVNVETSNNFQDFTDSGIRYLYQEDATIKAITPNPARGRDTGHTPIFLHGRNFVNSTSLRCRIGDRTVRATFITSQLIFCLSPKHATTEMDHGQHRHGKLSQVNFLHGDKGITRDTVSYGNAGNVFVEVANNGEDFTSSFTFFNYTGLCPTGHYCPIHALSTKSMCPRGTFCRGEGNRNFTLCPRGSYQPLMAQSECRRCPVGYICPDIGMLVPRLCPPGFVCDVTGMTVAEQPCPQGHFCLEGTATTATTCGAPKPSSSLFPTLSHAERSTTIRKSRKARGHQLVLGARNTACWQNVTTDFALQVNPYPSRFWMERHALPLSPTARFSPIRGRYCLDDRCLRLEDADNLTVSDYIFDYGSAAYALRRPIPCPEGTYCHPGTAVGSGTMKNFTTPQPCFESMYCPEGSQQPTGVGDCPPGYFSPFGARIACPAGTYCPNEGHWDPLPCPPGRFNSMLAQLVCSLCPEGFICPGFGRVDPAICPPGYICSSKELAAPNARCPSGFYCPNGTVTADPFRNDTTLRPYPCSPGTFCMSGAGFDSVKSGDFLFAQNCTEGFYCELGSSSPLGSGLCPKGFTCPLGTSVPIPTPPGYFAKLLGMVQPAACLPGYYAPTIETVSCYPCPPGTQCENDATSIATICPPGTFRARLGEVTGESGIPGTGVICAGCPQGTWSKNWELRSGAECTRCPPGTVCPIDGMTRPCTLMDFPTPYVPTNAGETQSECLKKIGHFFGSLVGPTDDWYETNAQGVDVAKNRGPIFQSSPTGALGACFRNDQPDGSVVFQRVRDYYGPSYPIQTKGNYHQGYGSEKYEGYFGRGSLFIDLPVSRQYEPARNCTPGYFSYNRSLNLEKWIIGTCEADIICNFDKTPQAQPCSEGYVCDEGTTALTQLKMKCPEGYVCDFGTTPDKSLEAPRSKYKEMCPAGYFCKAGTGVGQKYSNKCPIGYFCPTGSGDVKFGRMASDAVNQGLTVEESNPFIGPYPPGGKDKVLPNELYKRDVNVHDENCFNNINSDLVSAWEYKYDANGNPDHPLVNSWNPYAAKINLAVKAGKKCGRDHKWRLTQDAINRLECDCRKQVLRVLSIWRLWRCTKGWNQVPAWPGQADNTEWPMWAYGAGKIKLGSSKQCVWNIDLDNGEGSQRINLATEGLRMRLNWLDIEEDSDFGNQRWDHWNTGLSKNGDVWEKPGTEISWTQVVDPNNPNAKKNIIKLSQGGTELKVGGKNYCEHYGTVNAYDCLRQYITGEFRDQNLGRFGGQGPDRISFKDNLPYGTRSRIDKSKTGYDRFDPFTFDAHYAIEMIERYGDRVGEELIGLAGVDPVDPTLKFPLRLDMCSCETLLRCPNGTSSTVGSSSRFDCVRTGNEVLLRSTPVSALDPDFSRMNVTINRTASDLSGKAGRNILAIPMQAYETSTFTMDMRPLPTNMTYGKHYQISTYFNCLPCPARYVCAASKKSCTYPELFRQQNEFGVLCSDCCKCQRKAMPAYFTDATGGLQGARVSEPYDERFYMLPDSKHDIIQVSVTALQDSFVYFVVELIHGQFYGAFEQFIADRGQFNVFTPHRAVASEYCSVPCKYPKSNPWNRGTGWGGYILPDGGGNSNPMCSDARSTLCNRANFMAYIMRDDYEGEQKMNIFYNHPGDKEFENELLINRIADWWVGDPLYSMDAPHINSTRGKELTMIRNAKLANGFIEPSMEVLTDLEGKPLTMIPPNYQRTNQDANNDANNKDANKWKSGAKSFQYGHEVSYNFLTDSLNTMTAQEIQDSISRYEGNMFIGSRLAVPFSGNPKFIPKGNGTGSMLQNVTAQVPFQHRFHPLDRAEDLQMDVTWWDKADARGPNGPGLDIMALPYFPFFSNCRGYDSHLMIAKLLEDHPNCTRISLQETQYVAQLFWQGPTDPLQRPTSDECTLLESESENYNKLWRMTPPDGFPDDEKVNVRREAAEALGHYYLAGNEGVEAKKGVKLSCQYEEPIYVPAATPRWYQQPLAKTLFWLSKWPQPVQDFAAIPPDPLVEDDTGFGWGRTPRVLEMYEIANRELLVPVQVGSMYAPGPGQTMMVPRTVVLDISFFQRGRGTLIPAAMGLDYRLTRDDPALNGTKADDASEENENRRMRRLLQDVTSVGAATADEYTDVIPEQFMEPSKTLVKASIDFYDKCAITDVPKLLIQFSKLEPPVYICDAFQLSYCNLDTKMCESPVSAEPCDDSIKENNCHTEGQFEPQVQPTGYEGTMRLKRGLLKEGFHCEKQTDCRHYEYSLEVFWFGMSWFGLLNSFELDEYVYILIFLLIGGVSVATSALVWSIARMLTRLKYPPPFRWKKLMALIAPSPLYGVLLAITPIAFACGMIRVWFYGLASTDPINRPSSWAFEAHNGDWLYTALMTIDVVEGYRVNRVGYAVLCLGMYCIFMGAKLFVPNAGEEAGDDARIDEVMAANAAAMGDDEEEEMLPPSEFWTPLLWKRAHLLLWTMYTFTCLMICWEFSYSDIFGQNIYQWIVIFKLMQMLMDQVLAMYMKENLLIASLMVSIEVTEFMVSMGASSLVDFLISYFVELGLMIAERLLLDPGLKYVAKLWPKWKMMLKRRFAKKRHMTREQRAREEAEWKRINEEIALESEGVEPLIDAYAVYANETIAMLLGVFVLLFIYTFEETQIEVQYNIKKSELMFYIYFCGILIPFNFMMDMFLWMTQELIHGWKVYDFVAYQKYRFSVRENRWQMEAWDTLDESIAEPLQTIDMMCFSSQFYFICTIHGVGMLLVQFGLTIILRNFANPFSDSMLPVIMLGIFSICTVIQWLGRLFADASGIWVRKSLQGTVDDEIAAKLAIGEGRQADLEAERLELQALNSERFRHRFLDRSRPWVLQHLVELLTPRTLEMPGADGRPVIEYIRDVYHELMALGEGRRRPGDREDISSDSGDEGLRDKQASWSNAPLNKSSGALLRHWLEMARRRRALKKLVDGTIKRNCGDTCALCACTSAAGNVMRCDLAKDGQASDHAIDDLIKGFEMKYPGRKFEPNLWVSYFRSEAQFITRCQNCVNQLVQAQANKIKKHTGANRATRAADISDDDEDEEEQAVFEPMVVTRTSAEGKVMSKWLNAARRRLGGSFPRPNARAEMEAYAAKMREYKLKKAKADMRAKGFISDDEDEDGNVKLKVGYINAASKALAQLWLERAREYRKTTIIKEREDMKLDIRRVMEHLTEEHDWYYGQDLRLTGKGLKEEGDELQETRRQFDGDAKASARELETNLQTFTLEKEAQAQKEIEEIEEKMRQDRVALLEKAEMRIQEITRNKTRLKTQFEKEVKLAPPEDRAGMVAVQKEEVKKLDALVEGERKKQAEAIQQRIEAGKSDLGARQRKRQDALQTKKDTVGRQVKMLFDEVDVKMRKSETNWLHRSAGWIHKAERKVAAKQKDDEAKKLAEKERKKRKRLRA